MLLRVVPRRVVCLAVALVLLVVPALAAASPFSGAVLDGTTLKPIRGAIVSAPDGTTAKTDRRGVFRFPDLPAGPVEFAIAADGYEATLETVEIAEGGTTDYVFILFKPGASGEVIEIEDEAPVPPPPGRQDLGRKEIQRIPGTRGDALTAVRSLPGVGSQPGVGAGPGQVIIRGSAPEESKIMIDGVEIPVLYHFFGLQSVLPTEMIENIEFLPGGFGAEEGRATGGIINVVTRSEAVGEAQGFAELSFINLAGFVQTPLSKKHNLQLTAGLRRSTIDLILPAVLPEDANLDFTTAPQYYDGQLRLDWRPRETDRISVLALGSYDLLALLNDNVDPNEPDFRGSWENETWFTRLLATWQYGKQGKENRLVVSTGPSGFRFEIGNDRFLKFGQWLIDARDDASWKVNPQLRLRAGAEARWDRRSIKTRFPAPPVEGQPPPGNFSVLPIVEYDEMVNNNVAAAYLAADFRPVESLLITPGVRLDHFAFIDEQTVSPRLQVTQQIAEQWTAKLAMGAYTRGLENAESVDPDLVPERAFQYVLGGKYEPRPGVSLEASVFYNDKRRLVTSDPLQQETMPLQAFVNRGWGRSFGSEMLVRARLDNVFGWLAYTLSRSDRIDGPTPDRRLFDYDETHNIVAVGSYTLGKWQFGGRFQYATGAPLTPVVGSLYLSDANAFIPVYGEVNSDRIESVHQLDLRIDREWRFQTWKLSAYLDVTNVYAHARVLGYSYNYDYSERTAIKDLPIVPALGVRGTF